MKEATGELNMTVVTVVAVAALMVFFYAVIWPTIKTGMALNNACNTAGQSDYKQSFDNGDSINCSKGTCTYTESGGSSSTKNCSD